MTLPPLRVLVIDDNATNRGILRHQLAGWGADVRVAPSGLEGLEELRLAVAPFDLVVLDYRMPGLDGLAVARTIQQNPDWSGNTGADALVR
ncbi:MAG: response regulator [Gammaproteobacteria bacterium]|nr:response regulator [Gammaproteobacteria bacterium]